MADPTSVSNGALGELGATLITSFDEQTSLALLCRTHFADARDMALELHPWNFAGSRATLVQSPDTPACDWQYQYRLPSGPRPPYCIKVRGTEQGNNDKFEVGLDEAGERVLFSDRQNVKISYTSRVENLAIWSPLAIQVLIKVLAGKLAKAVTGQNSTERLKYEEALGLLPEARSSDGREGTPVVIAPSTILTRSRHRWGGRVLEGLLPGTQADDSGRT